MGKKVFIAGHRGLVGSALVRHLSATPEVEVITRTREELDLTRQQPVEDFFAEAGVDEVYLSASKVGGIHANSHYPAEFIYQNLAIQANVINAAKKHDVSRLLFLGSSCIYPRLAPQPIPEEALLSGPLEPTNEAYAISKIAGLKMCEAFNRQYGTDFRSVMPTNLFGPGDNFHPENSHVIPALMRRFHEAKLAGAEKVVLWGTGRALREFLHVDDMAAACVKVMELPTQTYLDLTGDKVSHINVGSGKELSIAELAQEIGAVVGFEGSIEYDTSKPDGTPRKLMDNRRLKRIGWEPALSLRAGLTQTYDWFLETNPLQQ